MHLRATRRRAPPQQVVASSFKTCPHVPMACAGAELNEIFKAMTTFDLKAGVYVVAAQLNNNIRARVRIILYMKKS
jgi:putative ubiquitin-RnfH superfamily antitoxin RatB of RatAB toxin-antitoxin module